jgi:hypothetical protein
LKYDRLRGYGNRLGISCLILLNVVAGLLLLNERASERQPLC